MEGKYFRIGGRVYDLSNPEEKKEAVRAWLKSRQGKKDPGGEKPRGGDAGASPTGGDSLEEEMKGKGNRRAPDNPRVWTEV
jgi:hypothetical protein